MPNNQLPTQNSNEIEKNFEELVQEKINEHFHPKTPIQQKNSITGELENRPPPAYSKEIEENLRKMWNEPENKERLIKNEKDRVNNVKSGRIERELKKQSEESQSTDKNTPRKPANNRSGAKIRGF
jgi:hypothetical protein